jgi:hypothetical protein
MQENQDQKHNKGKEKVSVAHRRGQAPPFATRLRAFGASALAGFSI